VKRKAVYVKRRNPKKNARNKFAADEEMEKDLKQERDTILEEKARTDKDIAALA